jgi:hypothetical protein
MKMEAVLDALLDKKLMRIRLDVKTSFVKPMKSLVTRVFAKDAQHTLLQMLLEITVLHQHVHLEIKLLEMEDAYDVMVSYLQIKDLASSHHAQHIKEELMESVKDQYAQDRHSILLLMDSVLPVLMVKFPPLSI